MPTLNNNCEISLSGVNGCVYENWFLIFQSLDLDVSSTTKCNIF